MFALLAGVVVLTAGCADEIADPAPFLAAREAGTSDVQMQPATCSLSIDVPTAIFAMRCGTVGCHVASSPAGSLDLVTPGVGQRLIGVHSATCAGASLVSTDGTTGFLFDKLMGMPRCGSPMPLGGAALTPAEVECVRAWTEAASTGGGIDAGNPVDAAMDSGPEARCEVPRVDGVASSVEQAHS